jgi:hypothetical protein
VVIIIQRDPLILPEHVNRLDIDGYPKPIHGGRPGRPGRPGWRGEPAVEGYRCGPGHRRHRFRWPTWWSSVAVR